MKPTRRLIALLVLAVLFVSPVSAKGVIVKIVIHGGTFSEPLIIDDKNVLKRFSIWSGPNSGWIKDGVRTVDYSLAFMDFRAGTIEVRPISQLEFQVEFYLAESQTGAQMDETYKVDYAITPPDSGGYFYLPTGNSYIYHGVEGSWLHSSDSWEELVRPLIERELQTTD